MEYKTNRRTGDRISVIGLGTSCIAETEEKGRLRLWNSPMRKESTMPTLPLQTQRLLLVYNQSTGEARYYHRENYQNYYTFITGSP